jgi:hypothetical protein
VRDANGNSKSRHGWPVAVWPLLGIIALVVINALIDAWSARGPGLLAPGAFLHVTVIDGVPAGALLDILHYGATFAILGIGMTPVGARLPSRSRPRSASPRSAASGTASS